MERSRVAQSELVCSELVQAEIDLAFIFLRMAETAIGIGSHAHALELIATASGTHKTARWYVGTLTPEFEDEKRKLQANVDQLFGAIMAVATVLKGSGLPRQS
jgi:hypothetical protein